MKKLQIALAKRKLKSAYLKMRAIGNEMSCGHALACHVSGRYSEAVALVNRHIRTLKQIDPECTVKELEEC